jgi:3-phosphoshikimate 1-carboxyvinyltransferase
MLAALEQLGIQLQRAGNDCTITGCGGVFPVAQGELFLGNAGTAFRPLTAALTVSAAHNNGHYKLSGVTRMHERPIGDLVDGLNQLGARINYCGNSGYPPLEIVGQKLAAPDKVQVYGGTSSQFVTALLMVAPLLAKDKPIHLEVVGELISQPYLEITVNLMARFGVVVETDDWRNYHIAADQNFQSPGEIRVEGDASSASYFLAAGAITGGPVRVIGAGKTSIQGDVQFADALAQMGAHVTWGDDWIEASAAGSLKAVNLDCNHIPDAAMTLAICALYAEGTTTLRNIASWRVKETDRLAAMAKELRKLGAQVREGEDNISITPPAQLQHAAIETYDDHRMAMCFSLATLDGRLRNGTALRILDPMCVAKTFPDYFGAFAHL